jgi:glutaconate CoA-transferase subunit B
MEASLKEMMVFAASKMIKDNDVVMVGTGLPLVASYLAKRTHAPNATLVFESGAINPVPEFIALGPGDYPLICSAVRASGIFEALSLNQRGKIDIGFLGGAEIDMYGNINSTLIGDVVRPTTRLPGSGGANDIASSAKKVVLIATHKKRTFPARVNYITSPGYIDGPGSRERCGLPGGGPGHLITDLGIFGFDEETKRMRILSIHPGATPEMIEENTQFEILGVRGAEIPATDAPDSATLKTLRRIDPTGIVLK